MMDKTREVWVDWMRVIACFMVMVVHCVEPFYIGNEGALILSVTDAWWVAFFNSVVRMCVPLFIIASSYLQFPLHYSTRDFFRKRFIRVCIPFAVWSLIYALLYGHPVDNLWGLLLNFNYTAGHLWFVYMLIGLYLLMPLLSPWAQQVSKRELQLYLGICFFTSWFPLLRDWLSSAPLAITLGPTGIPRQALYPLWGEAGWNGYGLFYYFSGFIGYLLLGLYFRRFVSVSAWRQTLCMALPCWLGGIAIVMGGFLRRVFKLAAGVYPVEGGLNEQFYWETTWCNDTAGVALMTVGSVLLFRKLTASGWCYRHLLMPISKASYGMYLSHLMVLVAVMGGLRKAWGIGSHGIWGIWTTPLQITGGAVITFVVVATMCVLVQRIPRVGKFLI